MSDEATSDPGAALERDKLHRRIERDFRNHPPEHEAVGERLDLITWRCLEFGHWLVDALPPGREQAQAIAALELVSSHSKAAVAREQGWVATHPLPE